jgi:hypothetical protein
MLLLTFQDEKGRTVTFNPAQIAFIDHAQHRITVGSVDWRLSPEDFGKVLASLVDVLKAGEPDAIPPATSGLILPA